MLVLWFGAMAAVTAPAGAQADDSRWFSGRYEVDCDLVGKQGIQLLKVWALGKSEAAALKESRRLGVQAVLFRGVNTGTCTFPAMMHPSQMSMRASEYFAAFFADGGAYQGYIEMSGDEIVDEMRVGKDTKIAAMVAVNTQRLRKDLEDRGILTSLGGNFDGAKAAMRTGGGATAAGVTAQKPSLMVFPSNLYLKPRGFGTSTRSDGQGDFLPDYEKAFGEDPQLATVIAGIASVFQDRGYPLTDLGATMRRQKNDAFDAKFDDRAVTVSMRDRILARARSDIRLDLYFDPGPPGLTARVNFILRAFDAYTDKEVATAQGQGAYGSASQLFPLLKEAVIQRMPEFEDRLLAHFRDIAANGREVRVEFVLDANAAFTFDSEFEGEELGDIVASLTRRGAVARAVQTGEATRTKREFSSVRIPLFDENGDPLNAADWAKIHIRQPLVAKYGLAVSRDAIGLGRVRITIGGKAR